MSRRGAEGGSGAPERFAYATVEALSEHIAVLDERGAVVAVNRAWRDFARANSAATEALCEGANYLAVCDRARGAEADDAARIAAGLRAVIGGEVDEFSLEYPCHSPTRQRWYIARVTRFKVDGGVRAVVTHADITERKLAEQRLAKSEEQLRAIFSASRDGILVEQDERVVYANDSYARLFGYAGPEELVGEHVSALVSPEDAGRLLDFGRRRLSGEGAPAVFEFRGRRRDGAPLDLEASVSTHTVAGKTYITTAVRDISERKLAEKALRESEAQNRLLLEQASDGIHTYDLRGNILEANAKLCEMLGYTRDELLALNVRDLVPAEDLAGDPIRFDALMSGQTLLSERRLRRKDGTLFPAEISGKMLPNGVLQAFIRDITERRRVDDALRHAHEELERRVEERTAQLARANELLTAEIAERRRAEETLRESEQRLKIALSTGRLGSWQLDLRTLELDASPAVKANFGRPQDAHLSREDVLAAIHPEDRARVRAAAAEAIAARGDYHAEYRVRWPDGDTRWLISRGRALYDEAGAPLRMVGVTVDITERRQAEEEREELLRRLVDAQEEERRRISRELHDQLGQRMTALMMGLKTLSAESHGRRSALDGLTALQALADDLTRELHMLAFGLRPPALDDLGLHTALYNYVEEWAEQARVPVDFHSSGIDGRRLPLEVETALYRIAQEALTNVLKHSGAGRVSVVLERVGEQVVAVIEDDGRGFDADSLLKSPVKGRKLGLLGMRERAAMLGGTLSVESGEGAGTSVFVRIPLAPSAGGAA